MCLTEHQAIVLGLKKQQHEEIVEIQVTSYLIICRPSFINAEVSYCLLKIMRARTAETQSLTETDFMPTV